MGPEYYDIGVGQLPNITNKVCTLLCHDITLLNLSLCLTYLLHKIILICLLHRCIVGDWCFDWLQGLIRYQEPQNDNIKDYSRCERLYEATIKILQRKPVVKNGPKYGNVGS